MLVAPDLLLSLPAKPVAIFGGGGNGEGVRALLATWGATGKIYDATEKTANSRVFTAEAARSHALVVFSAEFALDHPWLELAHYAGAECLSELDLAALCWRGRIVGVTGTHGKSMLANFVAHALTSVGRTAFATGRAGEPFAQQVAARRGGAPDTIAVCEVSSEQAQTLRYFCADALLWTNFAEGSLKRHASAESYFDAKWSLVERTDAEAVFVGSSVQRVARLFDRPLPITAAVLTEGEREEAELAGTVFAHDPEREVFFLTRAWWRAGGLLDESLLAAVRTFHPGRPAIAGAATATSNPPFRDRDFGAIATSLK